MRSDITTSNIVEGELKQGRLMSEVFLPRLLSTKVCMSSPMVPLLYLTCTFTCLLKMVLQPYVEDLFRAIFAPPTSQHPTVPKAIKYLFDFLEGQAVEMGISDRDIVHRWKTNR